ncbi:MAG TPA: hypothetical protein VNN07_05295 [Candidatus Tectomicrobia bacterium]|nr:hypothetical protein [Candidatus Tectomicrobia bacterium]
MTTGPAPRRPGARSLLFAIAALVLVVASQLDLGARVEEVVGDPTLVQPVQRVPSARERAYLHVVDRLGVGVSSAAESRP